MTHRLARHAAGMLLLAAALAQPAAAQNVDDTAPGKFCTNTANAARTACGNQAEADLWIAVGNCRNLPDPGRRSACLARAETAKTAGLKLCGAQLDERRELCGLLGEAPYVPRIDPKNFVKAITNPFMPLQPGTTLTYRAETDEGVEKIVYKVTDRKEIILGVECTVVRDTVTLNGELIEDTLDWFAQDKQGNVWYFGEISKSFENGDLVSLAGSWRAGVDGARPGIVMKANRKVGDVYRQEFFLGVAEDYARIESLSGDATTPAASCKDCVVTRDLVPLEPDADERKFFARGIGFILEVDPATGERGVELVRIERP